MAEKPETGPDDDLDDEEEDDSDADSDDGTDEDSEDDSEDAPDDEEETVTEGDSPSESEDEPEPSDNEEPDEEAEPDIDEEAEPDEEEEPEADDEEEAVSSEAEDAEPGEEEQTEPDEEEEIPDVGDAVEIGDVLAVTEEEGDSKLQTLMAAWSDPNAPSGLQEIGSTVEPCPAELPPGGVPKPTPTPGPCQPISSLEIVSVEFVSDHKQLKDYNADFNDGGARFPKPEWTPGKQFPVSHNMDQQVEIILKVNVGPPNACPETGTITGTGPGGMLFQQSKFAFNAGLNTIPLLSDKKVEHKVQMLNFAINWTIATDSGFGISTQTANKMYVTYDTPFNTAKLRNNAVTERRLSFLCSTCNGDTNGHDSVAKIHGLIKSYDPSAPEPTVHWLLADGKTLAQCVDSAFLFMLATEMLGLKTGTVVLVYPKIGKGAKETGLGDNREIRAIASSKPAHPAKTPHNALGTDEMLCFYDNNPVKSLRNNFEACYKFTHPNSSGAMVTKYYGGGAGVYDTPIDVMKSVCKATVWTYLAAVLPEDRWEDCKAPGPFFVETW